MPEFLRESFLVDLDLGTTILNVALAMLLGQVVAWHFVKFSRVLSDRHKFARVLPFLCATTMLMISVVKTSLALSLGLVGALSIVRFRTPIKEPEELAYLFLAIAAGIGLGADQRGVTLVVIAAILGVLGLREMFGVSKTSYRSLLQVEVDVAEGGPRTHRQVIEDILAVVRDCAGEATLRRVDRIAEGVHGTLLLDLASSSQLSALLSALEERFPEARFSLVDQEGLE